MLHVLKKKKNNLIKKRKKTQQWQSLALKTLDSETENLRQRITRQRQGENL